MNIIWFSEIRWDYLKTRKQHILSQFPEEDSILFIQPFNLSKKEKTKSDKPNIICKTVPVFRRGNRFSDVLSNIPIVRWGVYTFIIIYTKILIKKILNGRIDVICISNTYYIPILSKLKGQIVWDYNDDPEQFSPLPKWIKNIYYSLLSNTENKIVSSSIGLEKMIYERFSNHPITIPNGVELTKFEKSRNDNIHPQKIVLGYVGIVSSWFFDIILIKKISEKFPNSEIRIYGPQDKKAIPSIKEISSLSNVKIFPQLDYEKLPHTMRQFTIGIIPLLSIEKVWRLASGKLLQYLAVGIPVVSVYMEQYVGLNNLKLCKTHEEFIEGIDYFLSNSDGILKKNDLSEYDWNVLANQYRKILSQLN